VARSARAPARTDEDAHRAHREPDVDQGLAELNQPPPVTGGILSVAAAVEERLRQPPERVGDEAASEQDEQRARPAVRGKDAEGTQRVGCLPAVAERELQREDGDDREADALRRKAEPSEPADPLAASGTPGLYVRSAQRVRFLASLRALPAAC
jgi:hypothetical protein